MDSKAHFEPISNRTRCHAIFEENTGPVKNNGCYRLRESNTFSRAFLFALGPPLPALVSGVVILGRDGEKGGKGAFFLVEYQLAGASSPPRQRGHFHRSTRGTRGGVQSAEEELSFSVSTLLSSVLEISQISRNATVNV